MTLFDEVIDLLDLVGSRECAHELLDTTCPDTILVPEDYCEPCKARRLFARLTEARARVEPQDEAVKPVPGQIGMLP